MIKHFKLIYFSLVISGTVLMGCSAKNGINFEVENLSGENINNIKISASESDFVMINSLNNNEKVAGFLNIINHDGDGAYSITFMKKDSIRVGYGFGYYTNGSPLEKKVEFFIEADTVTADFKLVGF